MGFRRPFYSGLTLSQDKATKLQTVQIVRQGEATPYWFIVNPLYKVFFVENPMLERTTMSFQDNLAAMPDIGHLSGLDILDAQGKAVHHIPNAPGKQGSLKLYNALALNFGGKLDAAAAAQGLDWFAEHVADAQANPGKHPNIDLLLQVKNENLRLLLKPVNA